MINILIPTYGRSGRIGKVVENIDGASTKKHQVTFIIEPDDNGSRSVLLGLHLPFVVNERTANYAGAMNTAIANLDEFDSDFWFAGSDDLRFTPGWDVAALALMDGQTMVVGTNDLHNPFVLDGLHATHYLVDRRYIEKFGGTLTEGPGIGYYEGYTHQYTDTEFIGVAKARARFKPCLDSIVEHMHYTFGRSEHDATYTRAYEHLEEDRVLYEERKKQWDSLVV